MTLTRRNLLLMPAAGLPRIFAQRRADVLYDEAKVPAYTLPDVLKTKDGRTIRTAKEWQAQRRYILGLYENLVYGRAPGKPRNLAFHLDSVDSAALGGKAVRKLITVSFVKQPSAPRMRLLLYLPAYPGKPAPVFAGLAFGGIHTIADDPGVPLAEEWVRDPATKQMVKSVAPESSRGRNAGLWQVEQILSHGYGLAVAYYGDIEPDFDGGWKYGVRPLFFKPGQTAPDPNAWCAIAEWAWGLRRIMDYLVTDRDVDAERVAAFGHSRLGKAALWAGAQDTRFSIVISNESGEGGAAISRRDFGERTEDLNAHFPHWFCANYRQFDHHEEKMPFDAHFLLALVAPRSLYVASAEGDQWSDPKGEFLAAYHASPVWALFGKKGIPTDQMPPVEHPIMYDVAYHVRTGKHNVTAYDWEQYLKFAAMHWS